MQSEKAPISFYEEKQKLKFSQFELELLRQPILSNEEKQKFNIFQI